MCRSAWLDSKPVLGHGPSDLASPRPGNRLLSARLEAVRLMPNIQRVVLDTSQHTQAFYARFGFVAQHVVRDGYGAGLDRWDMALEC